MRTVTTATISRFRFPTKKLSESIVPPYRRGRGLHSPGPRPLFSALEHAVQHTNRKKTTSPPPLSARGGRLFSCPLSLAWSIRRKTREKRQFRPALLENEGGQHQTDSRSKVKSRRSDSRSKVKSRAPNYQSKVKRRNHLSTDQSDKLNSFFFTHPPTHPANRPIRPGYRNIRAY